MARIYSTRFLEGRNVTSGSLTVPSGEVWIVRDIDVFYGGGSVGNNAVNVTGSLGQTFAYFSLTALTSEGFEWRGRQVMNAGDTWGFVAGTGVDITISGYRLTAP